MTAKKTVPAKKTATVATPKPSGKSLEAFRSAHDKSYIIPRKIEAALLKLGDSWEYEVDFAKQAGVSITDLALFRDQFEAYVVAVKVTGGSHKKNVWAGTPAFAMQLALLAT